MWRPVGRSGGSARVSVALSLGLALLAIALAVVLSGSPLVLAHANQVPADEPIYKATGGSGACQPGETVPAGVSAIRLILVAVVGPRVSLTVGSPGGPVTSGSVGGGWTAGAVTVPVKPLAHPVGSARICFQLGGSAEAVEVGGSAARPALAARTLTGKVLPGRFTVEYMHRAHGSWWSTGETVARRLGLGHAPSGTWLAVLMLLAMGSVVAGASWLVLRELG
jgi:hypothetical protein